MVMSTQDAYAAIALRSKEVTILEHATGLLYWDMETKMPPRGLEMRSDQLSMMELLIHQRKTDPEIGRLLAILQEATSSNGLDPVQRRDVHLVRKEYDENVRLPESLVAETAKHTILSIGSWKKAKAAKDFSIFRDDLSKMIDLRMQAADILMKVKSTQTPYDALLDLFEPKMPSDRIASIFSELREGLMSLISKVESSNVQPDISILSRPIDIDVQKKASSILMDLIGYDVRSDKAGGRLDETEHPFTVGAYDDVRITTHYYADRFFSNMFSVMHEGGHALYDQGIPREWLYRPVGKPCSYGIHESQSRFMENVIGRSPEFLQFLIPRLRSIAPKAFRGLRGKDIITAVNAVQPSKIRVEADEVTYCLHVIIRFEIEREIFTGKLDVDEIPVVWNQKYKDYLGVEIENDKEGVLQDTHWAMGNFGYFPSYALGNIYSGMFLKRMEKDLPNWKGSIGKGDISHVFKWSRDNIHSKGNIRDPSDMIREVTGTDLTISPFLDYLNEKIGSIYEI